jgi:hypothetical protein
MHGECKKKHTVNITPDTIITADILAGLDKCPFCGALEFEFKEESKEFQCFSSMHVNSRAGSCQSLFCTNTTLRARVSELEAKIKRLTEAGDKLDGKLGCGCYEGPCSACSQISEEWAEAKESP